MACTLYREEMVVRCLIVERQILLPSHSKPRPLDANYVRDVFHRRGRGFQSWRLNQGHWAYIA